MPVTNSDNHRRAADTAWRPAGVGMNPTFRCARCDKPRNSEGRKKQRVQGVPQYVCRECVK